MWRFALVWHPRGASSGIWEAFRGWAALPSQRPAHQPRDVCVGRLFLPRSERGAEEDRGPGLPQTEDLQLAGPVGAVGQVRDGSLAQWAQRLLRRPTESVRGPVSPLQQQGGRAQHGAVITWQLKVFISRLKYTAQQCKGKHYVLKYFGNPPARSPP